MCRVNSYYLVPTPARRSLPGGSELQSTTALGRPRRAMSLTLRLASIKLSTHDPPTACPKLVFVGRPVTAQYQKPSLQRHGRQREGNSHRLSAAGPITAQQQRYELDDNSTIRCALANLFLLKTLPPINLLSTLISACTVICSEFDPKCPLLSHEPSTVRLSCGANVCSVPPMAFVQVVTLPRLPVST